MKFELTQDWVQNVLPYRNNIANKGDFGTLTILAGSLQYPGAAVLSACGALHTGAGIVRLASTPNVCNIAATQLPSCTHLPLEISPSGSISATRIEPVTSLSSSAILAGCGMTNVADTADIISFLLDNAKCPIVFDADALNVISGHLSTGNDLELRNTLFSAFYNYSFAKIITPHIGEMARLSGLSVAKVEQNMERIALQFAYIHQCIVVLKSHITVIASPDGTFCTNTSAGNNGLAKGGSGDVLAGIISSLLAQGIHPFVSAAAGVWLHAVAGDIAAQKYSTTGFLPSDICLALCDVFKTLGR